VVDGEQGAARAALEAVADEVSAIDASCSRFRTDSELSRLNAGAGQPFPASPGFMEAVLVALRAARLTGGLVDPTLGGALRQLGYDRDFAVLVARSSSSALHPAGSGRPVAAVVSPRHPAPGWRAVTVNRAQGTISLPEGVELDLGATAKALAADRAAAAAYRATGCGVLVSLGGDVAVSGPAPDWGWSVRVTDDHAAPVDAPGQTIDLWSGGLATSGTTVRRWHHGGQEQHHLLDPATGRPTASPWRTASVAAASCVDANTASTAAIVLGAAAPGWLAAHALPARLVAADGTVTTVSGWPDP
jgi:thiamine biosynthesis lipoprotein